MKTLFGTLLFLFSLLFTHCSREISFTIDKEELQEAVTPLLPNIEESLPADIVEEVEEIEEKKPESLETEYVEVLEQHKEIFYTKPLQSQAIDFVFILDVSLSMLKDIARLGSAFSALMSEIEKTNWRMAFTTADHGDHNYVVQEDGSLHFSNQSWRQYFGPDPFFGKLMFLEHNGRILNINWLHPQVPHYKQVFAHTLTRQKNHSCNMPPHCQGDLEQPLRAFNALFERMSLPEYPQHLKLRPNASLVLFIVTNEDERVEDSSQATKAHTVLENFKRLYPSKNLISFGILIKDDSCYQQQITSHSPDAVYGNKVAQLTKLTGGQNISICEKSYHVPLSRVSKTIKGHVQSFSLKFEPSKLHEIKVTFFSGQASPWALKGKQILFRDDLMPSSEIEVNYFTSRKQAIPKTKDTQIAKTSDTTEEPEEVNQKNNHQDTKAYTLIKREIIPSSTHRLQNGEPKPSNKKPTSTSSSSPTTPPKKEKIKKGEKHTQPQKQASEAKKTTQSPPSTSKNPQDKVKKPIDPKKSQNESPKKPKS